MSGYVQYPTEIGEDTGKTADTATPGCPLEVSETGIVTKREAQLWVLQSSSATEGREWRLEVTF